jgi:hypothetical protein
MLMGLSLHHTRADNKTGVFLRNRTGVLLLKSAGLLFEERLSGTVEPQIPPLSLTCK